MKGLFDFDGKLFKYGTLLADIMTITILWMLCSLPIITIGASTTAAYYVATRQVSAREGYISRDFFKSFKENFFQATGSFILLALLGYIIYVNVHLMDKTTIFYPIQFLILAVVLMIGIYIFPVISRFELKFFEAFRTAMFLGMRHIITTITAMLLCVALVMLCFGINPIFLFIGFGFYCTLTSHMFMRIFRKYLPDMDKDFPEDYSTEKPEIDSKELENQDEI